MGAALQPGSFSPMMAAEESMKRILLVSDTHGQADIPAIAKLAAACDLVIHLGDGFTDGTRLTLLQATPVIQLHGNVDAPLEVIPEKQIMIEGWPIFLTHGHPYRVKSGLDALARHTRELGCRVAFFGHVHRRVDEERDGVLLYCPSSPAYTQDGSVPAVALVKVTPGALEREWVPVSRLTGPADQRS